jgi:periplasmic protein TorT
MKHATLLAGAAIAATAITAGSAHAADKWWPAKYYNLDSGSPKVAE